ncbi:MAG: TldD/PmbA family protein [Candidatus Woesearchaeota archaeon]|nr:TldD/PmbA family protein [Candidatus Woesearchaeota archaeon]
MMSQELARYLLEKLKKENVDDVVISLSSLDNTLIKFYNNKIATTKTWNSKDLGIFVSIKKRLVSTSLKTFTKEAADSTVKKILAFSKTILPNEEYNGIAQGPFKYKDVQETYDKKVLDIDPVDYVQKGINIALENNTKRTAGLFETSVADVYLLTSNNVEVQEKGTDLYYSIRALVNKEESGHIVSNSRVLSKLNIEKASKKAAYIANLAKNPQHGLPGKYDVVFDHLSFANIIDNLGYQFSIYNVESRLSCLNNKLNKKIASSKLNLYDDATLPNGINSISFDSEGVPTQKNTLIKNGVLKTYLHNTSTAKKYKTKTTANAGLVAPHPFNLVIDPGRSKDLISEVKNGIYITNVWYTRFQNHDTGQFSTIPRDGIFYIKNGKIDHPIKDIRVSDNILNLMKNIKSLSKDQEQIRSWEVDTPCFLPQALIKNVNITKSQ